MNNLNTMSATLALLKRAVEFDKANRIAADMRFGGVYTPQGLENADREAALNASDRVALKNMMDDSLGMSGTVPINGGF